MDVGGVVVPSAEEAHGDARAGSGVHLAALHGGEQFRPGVLPRPRGRVPRSGELPVFPHAVAGHGGLQASWAGFRLGELAEEIVLRRGGQRCVAVGAADHAELEGISPQLCLMLQAAFQGAPDIFVGQHPLFLGGAAADVVPVPGFEVGELVQRGQQGMGFAVALDLGDFDNRLPAGAQFRVGPVDRTAVNRSGREHHAVGKVWIVGNGNHLAAGLGFVTGERAPQVPGVEAVLGGERRQPADPVSAVPVDHHPVQVVAVDHRCPLVADECREPPGIVVVVCRLGDILPDQLAGPDREGRIVLRFGPGAQDGGGCRVEVDSEGDLRPSLVRDFRVYDQRVPGVVAVKTG